MKIGAKVTIKAPAWRKSPTENDWIRRRQWVVVMVDEKNDYCVVRADNGDELQVELTMVEPANLLEIEDDPV